MSSAALDGPRLLDASVLAATFAAGIMLISGGAKAARIESVDSLSLFIYCHPRDCH